MTDRMRSTRARRGFGESGARYETGAIGNGPEDCAAYIAELTLELRNLAKSHGFKFLTLLLEMAFQEAFALGHAVKADRTAAGAPHARETR